MRRLPQSTAARVMLKVYLSSDHVSAATGKTVAITLSKAGAAFGNPSAGATNATEVANGWYYVDLSTTDTGTLADLVVRGTATACDDSEQLCQVVLATTGGLTALPNAAAGAANGLPVLNASAVLPLLSEWVWIDPVSGTAGGTGRLGDPVATVTQAYALGTRLKFVPAHGSSGGAYSLEVINFSGGLALDLNGWTVSNAQNGTFPGFERITSSLPGGRLLASGTLTMTLGPSLSNLIVEATTFNFKYGYFQNVFFNVSTITFATHNFGVRSDWYTCWFNNTGINAGGAFSGHHFNLLGCYGQIVLSGLKSGQEFTHLGWGALSVDGTGGTVEHTSHVEIADQSAGMVTMDLVSEPTAGDTWDELLAGHAIAGSAGKALSDVLTAGAGGDATAANQVLMLKKLRALIDDV